MFETSWRFFIRAIQKHRSYTALNVLGLAVGLAVTLLVVLYLKSELTYDRHHPHHERIYRLSSLFYFENTDNHFAQSSMSLAPMLQRETDAIESFVRIGSAGDNILLKTSKQAYYEDKVFYADTTYFDLFPSTFIAGDANDPFPTSTSIVLTNSLAKHIFGDEDPLGQTIRTNNNRFTVSAVIEDLPENNHIQFKALLPAFTTAMDEEELQRTLWVASTYTYIKLYPNRDITEITRAFDRMHDKYMVEISRAINSDYDIKPEQLASIHYSSQAQFDLAKGKADYLFVFAGVGVLILALAMINYMNLSTARASQRAKEIAVRKVLGSTRRDLVWQLLIESVLMTMLALLVSVVLVEIILQSIYFQELTQKSLKLDVLAEPWLIYFGLIFTIGVGLLSGLYPALALSKIPSIKSLKGSYKAGKKGLRFRRLLVGVQFTISISVVVLAVLMTQQMDYLSDRYLGFNKEDIVIVPIQDTSLRGQVPDLIRAMESEEFVISAAAAHSSPGEMVGRMLMATRNLNGALSNRDAVDYMRVGPGYFNTLEIDFVEGGSFDHSLKTDTSESIVVNQALVDHYGWENPIGKILEWGVDESGVPSRTAIISGVVRDFNAASMHTDIEPTVIFYDDLMMNTLLVRVNSQQLKKALAQMEAVWAKTDLDRPFAFSFLDENLERLYADDSRQARLISTLTWVTILISSLGLLGLASYTTQQRYREIGVRKVLGASANQIVNTLFRDIAILVGAAVLFSIPLSYAVFKIWVSNFSYAAPVYWYTFFATGAVAIAIAYVIVSVHSFQAARKNPVHSLKYE